MCWTVVCFGRFILNVFKLLKITLWDGTMSMIIILNILDPLHI
jgi:hypothetical protein